MPAHADLTEQTTSILEIEPAAFLSQLFHLSDAHLVVRAGGVSLFRRTDFGLFDAPRAESRILRDSTSGLKIDPNQIRRICFVEERDAPDCFEVDFAGIGFSLAIFPGKNPHDQRITSKILGSCVRHRISFRQLCARGFGTWLDEGLSSHGNCWRNQLTPLHDRSELIRLDLCSPGLEVSCILHPSGVDRTGTLWRIFDASTETVLHLDPSHPSFGQSPLSDLSRHSPDLVFSPLENHHILNATLSRN